MDKSYLAWVHDVGADEVAGRSLVERLELREGFSYWWMTPLSEKCNYSKSPQIDHAIRLLAYAHTRATFAPLPQSISFEANFATTVWMFY